MASSLVNSAPNGNLSRNESMVSSEFFDTVFQMSSTEICPLFKYEELDESEEEAALSELVKSGVCDDTFEYIDAEEALSEQFCSLEFIVSQ